MYARYDEVLTTLAAILHDVAGVPIEEVCPEKSFVHELDLDSLSMMEVIMTIEEEFEVRIDDDGTSFETVDDAVEFILMHAPEATFTEGVHCHAQVTAVR